MYIMQSCVRFSLLVFFFVASLHIQWGLPAESPDEDQCFVFDSYTCQNDGKHCEGRFYEVLDEEEECRLGYAKLFAGRVGDAEFGIDARDAVNGKFSVVSYLERNFTVVDKCCGVKGNETCMLRPQKEDEERYILYFDGQHVCQKEIQEFSEVDEWCNKNKTNRPCISFEFGKAVVLPEWVDTSFYGDSQLTRGEFCFFDAPVSAIPNIDEPDDSYGYLCDVQGFKLNETNLHVYGADVTRHGNASVKVEPAEYMDRHHDSPGRAVCFFGRFGSIWVRTPCCIQPTPPDIVSNRTIWITIACVAVTGLVCFIVLAGICVYRKVCRGFKESEIPKAMKTFDDDKDLGSKPFKDEKVDEIHSKFVLNGNEPFKEGDQKLPMDEYVRGNEDNTTLLSKKNEYIDFEEAVAVDSQSGPSQDSGFADSVSRTDGGGIVWSSNIDTNGYYRKLPSVGEYTKKTLPNDLLVCSTANVIPDSGYVPKQITS